MSSFRVSEPHKILLASQCCHHINALINFLKFCKKPHDSRSCFLFLLWKMLELNVILITNSEMTFTILIILEIQWIKNLLPRFLQRKTFHFTLNHKVRFKANVRCASFYGFSCEVMPEQATWTTAGVNGKVGDGSVESDTWCSPATGTKTPQLPLWCCPGGVEKKAQRHIKVHVNTAESVFLKSRRMIYCCHAVQFFCKLKECCCGISFWFFSQKFFE